MRSSSSSQAAAHAPPHPLPLPLPLPPPDPLSLPTPLPPPPLSLPSPPAAPRRGRQARHRTSSVSSSSSSSSSSAASSFSFCPWSPSPAASPARGSAASLVPFSWERHPGVPKASSSLGGSPTDGAPLPLPPPLVRPAPRRRLRRSDSANVTASFSSSCHGANSSDPFVAAFAECTKEQDDDVDSADHGADDDNVAVAADGRLWLARAAKPAASSGGRRWRIAGGGGGLVGFLHLYGCKQSAMVVAEGAFLVRRPPVVAHGRRGARR